MEVAESKDFKKVLTASVVGMWWPRFSLLSLREGQMLRSEKINRIHLFENTKPR